MVFHLGLILALVAALRAADARYRRQAKLRVDRAELVRGKLVSRHGSVHLSLVYALESVLGEGPHVIAVAGLSRPDILNLLKFSECVCARLGAVNCFAGDYHLNWRPIFRIVVAIGSQKQLGYVPYTVSSICQAVFSLCIYHFLLFPVFNYYPTYVFPYNADHQ